MRTARICNGCHRIHHSIGPRCAQCAKRRNAQRNAEPDRAYHRTPEYRAMRAKVLAEAEWECYWCRGQADTLDFKIPLAEGGPRSYDNAVAACRWCNSRRGATVRRTA